MPTTTTKPSPAGGTRPALSPPVALSSGRLIIHSRDDAGAQRAIPDTGAAEMTEAEWNEYCAKITDRMRASGFQRTGITTQATRGQLAA